MPISALRHAVVVDQQHARTGHGIEVSYQFKCSDCGYARSGPPFKFTVYGRGRKQAGTFTCQCRRNQTPEFQVT